MRQAYDAKNDEDYHRNTELILRKLDEIERTKTLRPTIAELARLTGLHRNTIVGRGWPVARLRALKEQGRDRKRDRQGEESDHLRIVVDRLDDAQKELVYWFRRCEQLEDTLSQMRRNLAHMSKARESYEKLLKQEREKVLSLEQQVGQLTDLLHT